MKKYDLLIKNGVVVTTTDMYACDVAVKDGKIAAMELNMDEAEAEKSATSMENWCFRVLWMYIHIYRCLLVEQFLLTVICQVQEQQPVVV